VSGCDKSGTQRKPLFRSSTARFSIL
jgi:hypothetical protein